MKKLISLMLAVAMVLTCISVPAVVSAEDVTELVNMTSATLPTGLVVSNANTYTLSAVNGYGKRRERKNDN